MNQHNCVFDQAHPDIQGLKEMVDFPDRLGQKACQEKKAHPDFLERKDLKDKRASQELMESLESPAKMDYPACLVPKENLAMVCLEQLGCLDQKEKQDCQVHQDFLDKKENLDRCRR